MSGTGIYTDSFIDRFQFPAAGNYACPEAAVSGTGIGEQFMRHVVAYDVAARLRWVARS